jgi:hypothetical protein
MDTNDSPSPLRGEGQGEVLSASNSFSFFVVQRLAEAKLSEDWSMLNVECFPFCAT